MPDVAAKLDELIGSARFFREEAEVARRTRTAEQELLRTIKYLDLPVIRAAGANPFSLTGDQALAGTGQLVTPLQGYVWFYRNLTIEGMTRGGTPDVIQILRKGRIFWELNGNQYSQTWGRGEKWLFAGETLSFQSVGTFASTAQIIISGGVEEVATEMIGKLR